MKLEPLEGVCGIESRLPEERECLWGQKDALSPPWLGKDLKEDPMLKIHHGGAFLELHQETFA